MMTVAPMKIWTFRALRTPRIRLHTMQPDVYVQAAFVKVPQAVDSTQGGSMEE